MKPNESHVPFLQEVAQAEERLTPELMIQSEARSSILSNTEVLTQAGISLENIQTASNLASEQALKEFNELKEQGPIANITAALEQVLPLLDADDRALLEFHTASLSTLPVQWRDKLKYIKDETGVTGIHAQLNTVAMWNQAPTFLDSNVNTFINIFSSKRIGLLPSQGELGDRTSKEVVKPSAQAMQAIFTAFGAEIPVSGNTIVDGEMIPTNINGVMLDVNAGRDPRMHIVLSPEAILEMTTISQKVDTKAGLTF